LHYDLGIQNAQIIATGGIYPANVYCSNGKIVATAQPVTVRRVSSFLA
jgi:hypothetical protein